MYVLDEQRSKVDDKSQKYIFIGYDKNSKGYKLHHPNTRKTSSIEMLYSVKKEKWIRDNRMKTTASFHTLKKTI